METPGPRHAEIKGDDFELKKTKYFASLGIRVREALKLHQSQGLLEKSEGTREWGNVSEHCLVEVARVEVLADALNLSPELKHDLMVSAAIHDALKRKELELIASRPSPWQGSVEASKLSSDTIRQAGFSERVVRLEGAVALEPIPEVELMLRQSKLSDEDVAFLIQHYVDAYTVNAEWVQPKTTKDGATVINELDRRIDKNESNPKYKILNEEGRKYFSGATAYETQRRIGHDVENALTNLIRQHQGIDLEPLDLPEYIDQKIRENIEG